MTAFSKNLNRPEQLSFLVNQSMSTKECHFFLLLFSQRSFILFEARDLKQRCRGCQRRRLVYLHFFVDHFVSGERLR